MTARIFVTGQPSSGRTSYINRVVRGDVSSEPKYVFERTEINGKVVDITENPEHRLHCDYCLVFLNDYDGENLENIKSQVEINFDKANTVYCFSKADLPVTSARGHFTRFFRKHLDLKSVLLSSKSNYHLYTPFEQLVLSNKNLSIFLVYR